jgi:uncharacterized tellurite resistance protein B-like protein
MSDAIRSFLKRTLHPHAEPGTDPNQPVRIAACALLLEIAHADDQFSAEERGHIEEALGRHFDMPAEAVSELIELAEQERRRSTDLYQFTAVINESYDEGQRMALAEVLWRVVFADGRLSRHESYLMQKLSSLLELRPGYLAEARKRAGGPPLE